MMVPENSAIHAGKHCIHDQWSINEDHSNIVKFNSPFNSDYEIIESRIKKLVADAPGVIRERVGNHRKSKGPFTNKRICAC